MIYIDGLREFIFIRPVASLNNQGGQHSLHGENIGVYTVVRTKLSFIGGALAPFAPPPPP